MHWSIKDQFTIDLEVLRTSACHHQTFQSVHITLSSEFGDQPGPSRAIVNSSTKREDINLAWANWFSVCHSYLDHQPSKVLHVALIPSWGPSSPYLWIASTSSIFFKQIQRIRREEGLHICMGVTTEQATRFWSSSGCMAHMSLVYWTTITAMIIGMSLQSHWSLFPIFISVFVIFWGLST